MPTFIGAFEVPPDSDDAFLASWAPGPAGALHRALRSDVTLRFVALAPAGSADAAPPLPTHAAIYDIVHEDGEPEGAGGTVLITPFGVRAGGDERFLAGWERLRALFAARQGYLGSRLYRSTAPADFRFVALMRWSSPLMYARALRQPEIERAEAAQPFPGSPALYLAIDA